MRLLIVLLAMLAAAPVYAWNALGHKVVADIAWQCLDEPTRDKIVATLRRHPRFDDDFARKMPAVDDDGRWIFQQAAIWPDMVRNLKGDDAKYNHPTWHYVNHPTYIGQPRPVTFNLSQQYPTKIPSSQWNVAQAYRYCRVTIDGDASPAVKAQAYCWLFHIVGDIHQPLHTTCLVCDRFPTGDQGGNLIVVKGGKLHSLWDNLLGRQDRMADVGREIAELKANRQLWEFDTRPGFAEWVNEARQIARDTVYGPLLDDVDRDRIDLPQTYFEDAGRVARRQVVKAGVRLGLLLGGSKPKLEAEPERPRYVFTPQSLTSSPAASPATAAKAMSHWLNTDTNVRHNQGCRYYGKTKVGRRCSADEGEPCGICKG